MELKLPPGFDYVSAAEDRSENGVVNVIGVIVDYRPPVKSRGVGKSIDRALTQAC